MTELVLNDPNLAYFEAVVQIIPVLFLALITSQFVNRGVGSREHVIAVSSTISALLWTSEVMALLALAQGDEPSVADYAFVTAGLGIAVLAIIFEFIYRVSGLARLDAELAEDEGG